MRILFLHGHCPGHYGHVAAALAADPANRVVFVTREGQGEIPGVEKRVFAPTRRPHATTHHYVQSFEASVLNGQAVYRLCRQLRRDGFVPDVICAHSGYGLAFYVKDVFPETPILGYFEWYYHSRNSDADFLEKGKIGEDESCRIRSRNASILLDLVHSDYGLCPTAFQRNRFPAAFHDRLTVLHDGIDTDFFAPDPTAARTLPGVDLGGAREIVTYATRGMEPYRGFPQFMHAAAILLRRRPGLHVVVGGDDTVAYSRRLPDAMTYKQKLLQELPDLDLDRLHFVGHLAYPDYLRLLRISSAHVYLTVPFVLSWSLLEAMAVGCLVVASDTEPVREVVRDRHNGLLADFFAPGTLAERVEEALDQPDRMAALRTAARNTVRERYALHRLLPRHLALIRLAAAGGRRPAASDLPLSAVPAATGGVERL